MSDLSATLVPGQKIVGRYRLKKLLGRGGFGVVWAADDEELRMEVALKFLGDLIASNPEAVEDLKRETRFSLKLTHPHIVRIYGFFQDDSVAGLSMEHVHGGTLLHIRAARGERCFGLSELSPWVVQLCEALDYAHAKVHIVHRDLKPANLMIDQNSDLKVADFGISRSISDSRTRMTNDRDTSGTLAYMSPQQMLGDSASPADDIYSLGATLYDLLSGKPPFYTGDIVQQVLKIAPPPLAKRRRDLEVEADEVPEEWQAAIAACLEKEPENRPASAGEVAERLGLRINTRLMTRGTFTAPGTGGGPSGSPSSRGDSSQETRAMHLDTMVGTGSATRYTSDAPTVVVPETVIRSGAGRPPATGRVSEPRVIRRMSRLPVIIGLSLGAAILVGGGIVLATRSGGPGNEPQQAVVIPDPPVGEVKSADPPAGLEEARIDEDEDAGSGLAPARGEEKNAAPAAEAGDREEITRLRRLVSRGIASNDWDQAERNVRRLLAVAPGDPEAIDWLETVTRKKTERSAQETTITRLRSSITTAMNRQDWTRAREDVEELLRLVPRDAQGVEWLRKLNAQAQAQAPTSPPVVTTPPVSTPPPPKESDPPVRETPDRELIESTLRTYEEALEALDVNRYATIWVSLDAGARKKLGESFSDLKSQSISIQVASIDVSGGGAVARLSEKRTVSFRAGNSQTVNNNVTMHLRKSGDRWLIERLEFR